MDKSGLENKDRDKSKSLFQQAIKFISDLTFYALKLAVIILFVVVAWRIAWSPCSFDMSKFDFSDLLSLILALFAVAMSVAFYLKSTDSSNDFYDHIYQFTKDNSESLGRIEEKFSKHLEYIGKGQDHIQQQMDLWKLTPEEKQAQIEEKKEQVKEKESKEAELQKELKQFEAKYNELKKEFLSKEKSQSSERSVFIAEIEKLNSAKQEAEEKIKQLEQEKKELINQNFDNDLYQNNTKIPIVYTRDNADFVYRKKLSKLAKRIYQNIPGEDAFNNLGKEARLNEALKFETDSFKEYLLNREIISMSLDKKYFHLTDNGLSQLRNIFFIDMFGAGRINTNS